MKKSLFVGLLLALSSIGYGNTESLHLQTWENNNSGGTWRLYQKKGRDNNNIVKISEVNTWKSDIKDDNNRTLEKFHSFSRKYGNHSPIIESNATRHSLKDGKYSREDFYSPNYDWKVRIGGDFTFNNVESGNVVAQGNIKSEGDVIAERVVTGKSVMTEDSVITERIRATELVTHNISTTNIVARNKIEAKSATIEELHVGRPGQQINVKESIEANQKAIQRLDGKLHKTTAMMTAMTNIDFQDVNAGEVAVGAGVGHFVGEQAVAVGVAYGVNNDFKVHAKWSGVAGDPHYNAIGGGLTYKFKTR